MKFLFPMIKVRDIDKSLKFYTELLDMKVDRTMYLADSTLYFLADGFDNQIKLELTHNVETPQEEFAACAGFVHLAFHVESLDEFGKKMESLGYNYLYEPFKLPNYDYNLAFVQDPDGYKVELVEGEI